MTKKLWLGAWCLTLIPFLSGCSADRFDGNGDTGELSVTIDVDPTTLNTTSSRASVQEIGEGLTADDFTLRLTDAEGNSKEWPFSAFDGSKIKTGAYTLTAYSGKEGEEGFNKAYFEATKQVTIAVDQTTSIALTATLANSAITVKYTDALKDYMTDYSAEIRTGGATQGFAYPATETSPLFINPGEAAIYVTVTNPQGKTATLKAAEFTAEKQHAYTVTVDANSGNLGDAVMTVSFDDATVAETKEFVLSEELFVCPPPTISPENIAITFIDYSAPAEEQKFNIMAYGGLGEVRLTTSSEYLQRNGWPESIDLMKATDEQKLILKNAGFNPLGIWKDPGKLAVLDFTNVIRNIHAISGDNTSTFTVEVVDLLGKVCEKTAVLTATVTPFEFSVSSQEQCAIGATKATLNINFNGGDPAARLKIKYKNDRGTYDVSTISNVVSKGSNRYAIDVTLPATVTPVELQITPGELDPVTYTVVRTDVDFTATAPVASIFAKKAVLVIDAGEYTSDVVGVMTVSLSPASGQKAVSGNNINLSALTPGTEYTATLTAGSKQQTVTFTTEAATQLPNGNMESWSISDKGSNWDLYVPASWGTNNPMTTSQGADLGYCRVSGTQSTTDSKSGNAALVRTNGWGSDNTAVGVVVGKGGTIVKIEAKMKYADPGLLHLGTSRSERPAGYSDHNGPLTTDDLTCGISFASRPSSMSFWYKYIPKNSSDKGVAEIYVYGMGGTLLAKATKDLASASSYTEITLPLTYAATAGKASSIYVKFLSTNDRSFLSQEEANFTPPAYGNLSRDMYYGSQLFIDEITLNY